ncbi:non-ribosomal peptide synthetase [Bacillus pseudomycoides]|uniref:Non-ribosomal peptide synthetase n=2 Tax=Bacillus cereus group TaxID=86661 RepID=A0A2B6JNR4_9BACI|nr:non-ribosomal peptide synthetase [Bacillus pseudomycoides]PEM67651.1 non-ribosomal peptide synthetase [Bacillus pseudomycoides]PGC45095.1 non-ribosomal peptide synthetase [Bacillus pseudomycoides]PGD26746.1 non-ribosomal peptide synthetase [Bacillus pseudomycoides]
MKSSENKLSEVKKNLLRKLLQGNGNDSSEKIRPYPREGTIPLSYAQKRLWFLSQLYPNNHFYNVPYVIHFKGNLHIENLKKSTLMLIKRHESLRTTFQEIDGTPVQVIQEEYQIDIPDINLNHLSLEQREKVALEIIEKEIKTPFDIQKGPNVRAQIISLDDENHYFIFNVHHICFDGWSAGVFFKELSSLYESNIDKSLNNLSKLSIQYADYTFWQKELLEGGEYNRQLRYWEEKLNGDIHPITLPYEKLKKEQSFNGAIVPFYINSDVYQEIKSLSNKEGASIFMTLLAIFKLLLSRYSNQNDILVGTPIANRSHKELEGIIGFFANTLILRTDVSWELTFRELLERIQKVCLDAYSHQDLPFEKIVEELAPERDLNKNPLFQVMFNFYEAPDQIAFKGLQTNFIDFDNKTAKFDLQMEFVEKDEGLYGILEYNTDLFHKETIDRMIGHYQKLTEVIVRNPDLSIKDISFLLEEEENLLLDEWNETISTYSDEKCLHQLFEEKVNQYPDDVAIIYEDQKITYRELNRRANALAMYLKQQGVSPDMGVGIYMRRSIDMVIAVIGILKAGGMYVPLDPNYPVERLEYISKESNLFLILMHSELDGYSNFYAVNKIYLDKIWDQLTLTDQNVKNDVNPQNLIYLIYTSGSTGKPKGIGMTHQAIVNLIEWQDKKWIYSGKVNSLQFSSLNFDMSCLEIFSTFNSGGTLVIPNESCIRDPYLLLQLILKQKIERASFPYVGFQQLCEVSNNVDPLEFNLKEIIVTGEQLKLTPKIRSWIKGIKDCVLHNHYGPSETHVVTSYTILDVDKEDNLPPIGRPISNTKLYVLDKNLKLVPLGVVGELYISGDCLAREYLNRPELTKEKFIENPFCLESDEKMYKTGDLVRYKSDGNIQFLGRIDSQLKIRGYRIEPSEVESIINQFLGIKEVVVESKNNASGYPYLIAYYVTDGMKQIKNEEIESFLVDKLPDYMIPRFYVQLDAIPLTPSGKINRLILPDPNLKKFNYSEANILETETEKQMALIWSEVLGYEHIGREDNFFHLGGHSLIATQVISRIRKKFNIEIPLRGIFEYPVLKYYCKQLDKELLKERFILNDEILSIEKEKECPLSFSQERIWFFDQMEPGNSVYNLDYSIEITGELDISLLEASLNFVVNRHEILRTTFQEVDGNPVQVIALESYIPVSYVDLRYISNDRVFEYARQLAADEVNRPFNLAEGPLIRAKVYQLDLNRYILVVSMHHIVTDGWSMKLFGEELFSYYKSYGKNTISHVPKLPIQYKDFAYWQRKQKRGNLQKQLAYWKEKLNGELPILNMPSDYMRSQTRSFKGDQLSFAIEENLAAKLKTFSQEQGVSLFMTLITGFKGLLFRYTEQEDLIVGTPIANRNHKDIENLIGFFVNTLPLRTKLNSSMSWKELLNNIKQVTLEAYEGQDIPFEKLVNEIQPMRDLSNSPIFQVMFAFQNKPITTVDKITELSIQSINIEGNTSLFDISMSLEEKGEQIIGVVDYCSDLFKRDTIQRFINHYLILLEEIVWNVNQKVLETQMLSTGEMQKVIVDWNRTEYPFPEKMCVHKLIEVVVKSLPNHTAIMYQNKSITYWELNEKAEQMARFLKGKHVGPNTPVILCMDRSIDFIVSILGILKAGGAYVPLDPSYPQDRLSYMIKDSQASVILTSLKYENIFLQHKQEVITFENVPDQVDLTESVQRKLEEQDHSEHLAFIIYTSGSTGKPKGVPIKHQSIVNFIHYMTDFCEFTKDDRVGQYTSISFDLSVMDIFMTLVKGSTLVLSPNNVLSANEFSDWIEENKISSICIPTAYWDFWVREISNEKVLLPSSLRMILVGGEKVSLATYTEWYEISGEIPCLIIYGPAETTCASTVYKPENQWNHEVVTELPIGRPIANTEVYVLNSNMQPVPIGVPGELYIGGVGLSPGYLNLHEKNEKHFVKHPFKEGKRLYKTGDKVKLLSTGQLVFLDRYDNQIKLRGFRIELGEIEKTLEQHSYIQKAIVILRDDVIEGQKQLVAYIQTRGITEEINSYKLKEYMEKRVPNYMIPSYFVLVKEMPKSPNGKIDRKSLPKPKEETIKIDVQISPRNEIEVKLANIWMDVLNLRSISMNDNFFHLGGHSLLATQVISRIRTLFGIDLPLKNIFEYPTISQLEKVIKNMGLEKNEGKIVKRRRDLHRLQ